MDEGTGPNAQCRWKPHGKIWNLCMCVNMCVKKRKSLGFFCPTENTFCSGDHVSWHSPLDNSESRIQHMLLTEDPQMQPIQTPFGTVSFLQVTFQNKLLFFFCPIRCQSFASNSVFNFLFLWKKLAQNSCSQHLFCWFMLFLLDCGCVHRGATSCTTVEWPRHPGADAWS